MPPPIARYLGDTLLLLQSAASCYQLRCCSESAGVAACVPRDVCMALAWFAPGNSTPHGVVRHFLDHVTDRLPLHVQCYSMCCGFLA